MNILGGVDFNVAAFPLESNRKNLLEICNFCQYQQLINVHIQITDKSATTINLFLTNNKNVIRIPGSVTLVLVTFLLSTSLENYLFPKGNQRSRSLLTTKDVQTTYANTRKVKTNYYRKYSETNQGDIDKSWRGVFRF